VATAATELVSAFDGTFPSWYKTQRTPATMGTLPIGSYRPQGPTESPKFPKPKRQIRKPDWNFSGFNDYRIDAVVKSEKLFYSDSRKQGVELGQLDGRPQNGL